MMQEAILGIASEPPMEVGNHLSRLRVGIFASALGRQNEAMQIVKNVGLETVPSGARAWCSRFGIWANSRRERGTMTAIATSESERQSCLGMVQEPTQEDKEIPK